MKKNNRVNTNLEKDIRIYLGTSGSGKSHQIKQAIKKDRRVLVFDPEGEYEAEACAVARTPLQLVQMVKKRHHKNFRIAFEANGQTLFNFFCKIVMREASAAHPLTVVVDELAGVTNVSKAADDWHTMLTRGRKYGVRIRAGAQSPTEIDKTIMRQRSYVWCGFMTRLDDFKYMSKETGLSAEAFANLRGKPHYDYIEHVAGQQPTIHT